MADSFKKTRTMSDLISQDILMEILKRLPIKSLLRFMCVQKSWYHLIKSPNLIDLHYDYTKNKNKYLLFQDRYHSKFFLRVDDKQCRNEYYPRLRLPCRTKHRKHTKKIHGISYRGFFFRTNSWKTKVCKDNGAQILNYDELYNSVIVNGGAYWVGTKEDSFVQVIVCFDVEKEKIQEIMLPPEYDLDVDMGHISSFNLVQHFEEVLLSAVYKNCGADTASILDIFALENDGVDVVCTKKVTIDLNKVGRNWWPIGFRNNDEIVLFNYHYAKRGFLSYDHEKKLAKKILDRSRDLWSYADICTPNNPEYDYNYGMFDPFDAGAEHMQFMYVNSFEESLVLLGEEL